MGAGIGPEHIARMAVAVQTQMPHIARALEGLRDAVERHRDDGFPGCAHIDGKEAVRQQLVARLVA